MANVDKKAPVGNPAWPENVPEGVHAAHDMVSRLTGASSPYGDDLVLPVPVEQVHYVHPYTRINR